MTGDVLNVESGDRVCSVEQNKAPALTELRFLWEMGVIKQDANK